MQEGYQGSPMMMSMQNQFAQDFQSVETSQGQYHSEPFSYNQGNAQPAPLPELKLYRSPNRKPVRHLVGSLFDGGIDVREERRRAEEKKNKFWAPHPHPKPQASMASYNVMQERQSAHVPGLMKLMKDVDESPKPLAMPALASTANFAAPANPSLPAQASADSSDIEDPAVNADGMLNLRHSETNEAIPDAAPPAPRRRNGGDPIMSKLAAVQRKLLALHHQKHPKEEMKPSPLIPDDELAPPPVVAVAPQPQPAPIAHRRHNRLWDADFERPAMKQEAPHAAESGLPPEVVAVVEKEAQAEKVKLEEKKEAAEKEAAAAAAAAAAAEQQKKETAAAAKVSSRSKKAIAKVPAKNPSVKALLSRNVNEGTYTIDKLASGKITPELPTVKESRDAVDAQEAKKELAKEEAEMAAASEAPQAAVPKAPVANTKVGVAATDNVLATKEADAVPKAQPAADKTSEKTDIDADSDLGVGTSDSDEEDDKALSHLEHQVDDFEEQQQQAMTEAKEDQDSP